MVFHGRLSPAVHGPQMVASQTHLGPAKNTNSRAIPTNKRPRWCRQRVVIAGVPWLVTDCGSEPVTVADGRAAGLGIPVARTGAFGGSSPLVTRKLCGSTCASSKRVVTYL